MSDAYELGRLRRIQESYARLLDRCADLEEALNDRDNRIADLLAEQIADRRKIDDLEHDTWRPHH